MHGSAHPAYRAAVEAIRASVPGDVRLGWLDHEQPDLATAAAAAGAATTPVVVLPLLLAAGYHARVDIPQMLVAAPQALVTRPLGPDPLLAQALLRRAGEVGAPPQTALVVAAAGSSDARALADVEAVVAELAARRSAPVRAGYLSGEAPRIADVVGPLLHEGHEVLALTYLICPGRLADTVASTALAAGAYEVTPPVGSCPEVTAIIRDRWAEATQA